MCILYRFAQIEVGTHNMITEMQKRAALYLSIINECNILELEFDHLKLIRSCNDASEIKTMAYHDFLIIKIKLISKVTQYRPL